MQTLFAFLAGSVGTLAAKVLIGLGVGILTVTGVDLVTQQLIGYVRDNYTGLGGSLGQIAGLAGVGQGLGIVLGAIVARGALWALANATRFVVH